MWAVLPLPIRRVSSLRRAPTPRGAPSPKKTKKREVPFPHLLATACKWWTTKYAREKTSEIRRQKKKKKKKMKTKPVRHFQVGYIHNPVKLFWVLSLITCFDVGNNFTTTNASNILSEFSCSLTEVSHGFNTNKKKQTKKKQHGSCSHGNRKLPMVLLLQIIIYTKVLYIYIFFFFFFFVVIKTNLSQQQPLEWLQMHYIKTMLNPAEKKQ